MIKINESSPIPIYQQIVNAMHHAILAGIFKPDHRLPSIRDLAVETRVNPNTIAKAYQEMANDGLIYFKRGQGAYVSPRTSADLLNEAKIKIVRRIKELFEVAKSMGMTPEQVNELFASVFESIDEVEKKVKGGAE